MKAYINAGKATSHFDYLLAINNFKLLECFRRHKMIYNKCLLSFLFIPVYVSFIIFPIHAVYIRHTPAAQYNCCIDTLVRFV